MNEFINQLKASDYIAFLSFLATFIAFYIPWRTAFSKSVSVEWPEKLTAIPINALSLGKAQYLHQQNLIAYVCPINIINPSNVAIGYFELTAITPKTLVPHMIMMKAAVHKEFQDEQLLLVQNGQQSVLLMPSSNTGTFPANSFTHFDLVITANPAIPFDDSIQIVFRVTYKSIKSRFYSCLASYKAKKLICFYHTFSKIYKLPKVNNE